jgi:hypothetical protein
MCVTVVVLGLPSRLTTVSAEMEAIETAAEHKLETIQYRSEKQRHSFESHVSMQMKCQLELEEATGTPIPELRKVCLLLKSLQVATMSVQAATILSQTDLGGSFDASVNYLRFFLSTTAQNNRTIVAFDGEGKQILPRKGKLPINKNKSHKETPGDSKALDRYYKPIDWWQLDQSTRDKVLAMHKKRTFSEVTAKEDTQDSDATTQRKTPPKIKNT